MLPQEIPTDINVYLCHHLLEILSLRFDMKALLIHYKWPILCFFKSKNYVYIASISLLPWDIDFILLEK